MGRPDLELRETARGRNVTSREACRSSSEPGIAREFKRLTSLLKMLVGQAFLPVPLTSGAT
jgi:hypothetical protein